MKSNVLVLYSISQTGSMRLGRDALVLTQAANSRSIAFLSQSLNEGKDVQCFYPLISSLIVYAIY